VTHNFENRWLAPTRIQIILWLVLVSVTLVLALGNYQTYLLGTHFDDARYVILARSLVLSDQYGMINAPGDPPVGKYPFIYPLLLAPFVVLFPHEPDALKLLSLIATVLNLSLLFWGWRWFSRTRSYWWGLAIAALYGLAPITIDLTRRVMSEPVFTTFVLLAIILAERAAQKQPGRGWSVAMSATLVGVLFTRSIGIILIACIFFYLILKRGRSFARQLALIVALMAVIAGIIIATTPVQLRDLLPSEYLKDENARLLLAPVTGVVPTEAGEPSVVTATPPDLMQKIKTVVVDYILVYGIEHHFGKDMRVIAFPLGGGEREEIFADWLRLPFLPMLLGYMISALVLFGWVRQFRQDGLTLLNLFGAVYLAVLFLWVWDDPRLLYPIQPQIHFGFLLGIEALVVLIATRARMDARAWITGIAMVLITLAVFKAAQIEDSRLHTGDIRARTTWLAHNASPSAIILTEAAEIDYLYSERKTLTYPAVASSAQLEEFLRAQKIDFILVAPFIHWQSRYTPTYSNSALKFRDWADELVARQRATLVHASESELIRVYQIKR
jgi:4-amino-4-deoxy-L-arabinose transferase-like glycosyltransferase